MIYYCITIIYSLWKFRYLVTINSYLLKQPSFVLFSLYVFCTQNIRLQYLYCCYKILVILGLYFVSKYIVYSCLQFLGLILIYDVVVPHRITVIYSSWQVLYNLIIDGYLLKFPALILFGFYALCTQGIRLQNLYCCRKIFVILGLYFVSKYIIYCCLQFFSLLFIWKIMVYNLIPIVYFIRQFQYLTSIYGYMYQLPTFINICRYSLCT